MQRRESSVPDVSLREVGVVFLLGCLLSGLMFHPIVTHLGSHIPEDLGDPVRTVWQLAWQGHALLHHPFHLYDSNAFWPHPYSFAFSDSLLGYAPASLIGQGAHAALVRYNLLFLFAYALCFTGAYQLARELGVGRLAGAIAGAGFAYAPFRLAQNGHLHVVSSGGIPLALFLLVRGYRRRQPKTLFAGWLVAAWQLTLGFTLGLQLVYLLAALAAIAGVFWLVRGRPRPPRPLAVATVAGVVVLAGVGAIQARPLLKVSHDYPQAHRTSHEVGRYSASPKAFLSAPVEDRLWGAATKPIRKTLTTPNEQNQFPGAAIFLLAAIGVAAGTAYSRGLRVGLAVGVLAVAVLSLGFGVLNGDLSYRLLLDYAPGWNGVRTPGRPATLTSLGLAVLAAAGAHRLIGLAARAVPVRGRPVALAIPVALATLMTGVVLAEGRGSVPNPAVPPVPRGEDAAPAPQMHLPTSLGYDRMYQYWSTNRFQLIANGIATFGIPDLARLRGRMKTFPDRRSVHFLRHMGIRSVILHLDIPLQPIPDKWKSANPRKPKLAATKSIAGLPLTRHRMGRIVVYILRPMRRRPA